MVYDIYSRREDRLGLSSPDCYQYTSISPETRVQIILLWRRCIGGGSRNDISGTTFYGICSLLREKYGVFHLGSRSQMTGGFEELSDFFIHERNIERCLDVIELILNASRSGRKDPGTISAEKAAETVNQRLREGEIGYQFENGVIVKVDSQIIHREIIQPTLLFLSDGEFAGANTEFLESHRKYRAADYEGCIVESLKAFESTLKIICASRGWTPRSSVASGLIESVFTNGLIPPYLQSQFQALRSVLESGIPTIRNRDAGHGRGNDPRSIPEYLASFVINQTASTILFLIKAHRSMAV